MPSLDRNLRKQLENTVKEARRVAEAGAQKALEQLAIHHHEPWPSSTPEQRALRNRLRAHGRQLGDQRDERRGTQSIAHLKTECAYEHWHRMLFARFLAETDLLIEPETGVAISLAECQELARERGEDWLEIASTFAERMLPQIFRKGDPVLEVTLPPETRSGLEDLLKALRRDVFRADDSLGWVYQFWQADKKEEINASEKKIGADELPAVTQLFTEDYMVLFLLHNTLGAWWAGKFLAQHPQIATTAETEDELRGACAVGDVRWTYLRFIRDDGGTWKPAAGTFDGWPQSAKEITLLDPCMGSGHFLVFALPLLVAFRMAEEGLSREAAIDAVLRDNLFGLEIDPRCTQIAAFNLAFAAWRAVGYRPLPRLNLACSGLSLGVTKTEWLKLAERAAATSAVAPERDLLGSRDNLFSARIKTGLEKLYDLFAKAPSLGSLIDPHKTDATLLEAGFPELEPLLAPLLTGGDRSEIAEMAVTAQGMTKAAELLARRFSLVATNVPYLGRSKQDDVLRDYCGRVNGEAKADLATSFLHRCLEFSIPGCAIALVTPQNWLFLTGYKGLRETLLRSEHWNLVAKLGPAAFQDMNFWAANTWLSIHSRQTPTAQDAFASLDVSEPRTPPEKAALLKASEVTLTCQAAQLRNPDARIVLREATDTLLLARVAAYGKESTTGDSPHYHRCFWELASLVSEEVVPWLDSPKPGDLWSGRHLVMIVGLQDAGLRQENGCRIHGQDVWGQRGVAVNKMNELTPFLYDGEVFDDNVGVIAPRDAQLIGAILCYCLSGEYTKAIREIDQAVKVTAATLVKVPFNVARWQGDAAEKYSHGLPKPHSSDPTQWLFAGDPGGAEQPLQVAVARMLGYRWPRQSGSSFPDCPDVRPDGLERHADLDGIVCLSPVIGEPPAAERLNALLADAFGVEWSAGRLASLLSEAGGRGYTLDDWLRDGFFAQECELYFQRPFIWHVWDGRRDGFHALVNYHKLVGASGEGPRTLDKLIYTYLGDWVDRQRGDQRAGVEGADARLAGAEHLKRELERIIAGEPPYDLFVRWKPLHEQPIGWEPDIHDGVRINIRPFMMAKPMGARGANACILRTTPRINWNKDRGKQPHRDRDDFPWFWGWDEETVDFAGGKHFDGNRGNDLHYTTAFKRAARERHEAKKAGGKR